MSTTTTIAELPQLADKARELCGFILESPEYEVLQGRFETFEKDTTAQKIHHAWRERDYELQRQHREGNMPTKDQIAELEKLRTAALENEVVVDYVESEQALSKMFQTVMKVVQKSLETGRVPTDEELSECCGSGG